VSHRQPRFSPTSQSKPRVYPRSEIRRETTASAPAPPISRQSPLKIGAELRDQAAVRPDPAAPSITVTLDSTFIRSCEDGERHLEVRIGNVETETGGRQVFGAVAK